MRGRIITKFKTTASKPNSSQKDDHEIEYLSL